MKKIALFSLAFIVLVGLAACGGPVQDGKYAKLAQCLTSKGVKLFGAFWCPHCLDQKAIFGDDMRYVDYVECDVRDPSAKPEECAAKNVDRYPTWFFPGQGNETGLHQPEDLAKKVGCEAALGLQSTSQSLGTEQTGVTQLSTQL
jgi:glutaredoxin